MHRRTWTSLVATAALSAACGLGAGGDPESAQELVDRRFQSTSVSEDGEARSLVHGRVEVSFRHPPEGSDAEAAIDSDAQVLLAWTSGCNTYNRIVEVTPGSIRHDEDVDDGDARTLIGCAPEVEEEEAWLEEFFSGSPQWELQEDELILSSDGIEIELEEQPSPSV